jgi:cytochrome c-type biogenesis protein CcmE
LPLSAAPAVIGIIAALVLNALNSNIALYITPTEVAAGKAPQGKLFRIGGLVKEGSIQRQPTASPSPSSLPIRKDIPVAYKASFPTSSRKARARRPRQTERIGTFVATEVLASTTKTTCRRKLPRQSAMPGRHDANKHVSPSSAEAAKAR